MSEIDYAARVQRGAALLDEKWPTWAQDIDLDRLNIRSATSCVTAQYDHLMNLAEDGSDWGSWSGGMRRLDLNRQTYAEHGFNGEEGEDPYVPESAYDTLNALWRSLILQRRSAAKSPEVTE